jgi:hypothetical protein
VLCCTELTEFFLDFFHPVFQKTRRFGNWICFHPQVKVGVQWLRLALSKGPNWVGVLFPTFTWGRKHPVSETSCFLEYWTMEKVQKNSVSSVQHTPSSESFQVYMCSVVTHILFQIWMALFHFIKTVICYESRANILKNYFVL